MSGHRIAIIGGGLSGIASAYELAKRGHQVIVFERRSGVAAEASFAPPGLSSQGLALDRMNPLPCAPSITNPAWSPAGWPQRWRHWRCRKQPAAAQRSVAMADLAGVGQSRLESLILAQQWDIEQATGLLLLMRQSRAPKALGQSIDRLMTNEPGCLRIDGDMARQLEPGLSPSTSIHQALRLGNAQVLNIRLLAQSMKLVAQHAGVRFELGCEVLAIEPGAQVQLHVDQAGQPHSGARTFDKVVVCAGTGSPALLRRLGLRLPWHRTGCLSITVPLALAEATIDLGPRAAILDIERGTSISRLGQRVRVAGLLPRPVSGDLPLPQQFQRLYASLEDWFPGVGRTARAQQWHSELVAPPDQAPLLGASSWPGVWMNTGHGAQPAATLIGCALQLADQMSALGRTQATDEAAPDNIQSLSPKRWC